MSDIFSRLVQRALRTELQVTPRSVSRFEALGGRELSAWGEQSVETPVRSSTPARLQVRTEQPETKRSAVGEAGYQHPAVAAQPQTAADASRREEPLVTAPAPERLIVRREVNTLQTVAQEKEILRETAIIASAAPAPPLRTAPASQAAPVRSPAPLEMKLPVPVQPPASPAPPVPAPQAVEIRIGRIEVRAAAPQPAKPPAPASPPRAPRTSRVSVTLSDYLAGSRRRR